MTEVVSIFKGGPIGDAYCDTETSSLIFDTATWCHENRQLGLIVGDPGIGKTTTLRRFVELTPVSVMVTMNPAMKSMAGVMRRIVDAYTSFSAFRAHELHTALSMQLGAARGLLVIDEAHHLNDAIIDELRCIHDEGGCPILFCGNATFRTRFNKEREGFGQVISRIGTRLMLRQPTVGDVEAFCTFRGIVDPMARKFLFQQSQSVGALRLVRNLINLATKLAEGAGNVRVPHLKDALNVLGFGQ